MSEPPSGTKLNYARRLFTDRDLEALPLRRVIYPYEEVDFSQNGLSAEGLQKVLELCLRCEKLRVLKLFKNDINDIGAETLAAFIRKCNTLEEMHLSHNRFTASGVGAIVTAAEQARAPGMNPMWLRLEQNDVSDPDGVLRDLQTRLSVCARKDRQRCTVRSCVNDCKVHLPHFHFQRNGDQEGPEDAACSRRRLQHPGKYSQEHRQQRPWPEDGGRVWDDGSWSWNHNSTWSDSGRGWDADAQHRGRKRWREDEREAHSNHGRGWGGWTAAKEEDRPVDEEFPMMRSHRGPEPSGDAEERLWRPDDPASRGSDGSGNGKLKVGGGIFQRAMAAAVKVGPKRPSTVIKTQGKLVPANVASRTLSRLGVLAKRCRVELKEKRRIKEEVKEEQDSILGSPLCPASESASPSRSAPSARQSPAPEEHTAKALQQSPAASSSPPPRGSAGASAGVASADAASGAPSPPPPLASGGESSGESDGAGATAADQDVPEPSPRHELPSRSPSERQTSVPKAENKPPVCRGSSPAAPVSRPAVRQRSPSRYVYRGSKVDRHRGPATRSPPGERSPPRGAPRGRRGQRGACQRGGSSGGRQRHRRDHRRSRTPRSRSRIARRQTRRRRTRSRSRSSHRVGGGGGRRSRSARRPGRSVQRRPSRRSSPRHANQRSSGRLQQRPLGPTKRSEREAERSRRERETRSAGRHAAGSRARKLVEELRPHTATTSHRSSDEIASTGAAATAPAASREASSQATAREEAAKAAVNAISSGRKQPKTDAHVPRSRETSPNTRASGRTGANKGADAKDVSPSRSNNKGTEQVKIVAARPKRAPKRAAIQTTSTELVKVPPKPTATKAASPATPTPALPKAVAAVGEPATSAAKGDDNESEYTSYTDDSEYTSGEDEEEEEEKEVEPEDEDEEAPKSPAPLKR